MAIELPFDFLIATSKSLFSYKKGLINEVQSGKGVYFGLSQNQGYVFAVARNNFDGTGGGAATGINSLEIFDKSLNHKHFILMDFILDGHQILFKDNALYVCNSGMNSITKINPDGQLTNIVFGSAFGSDVHHYNSIGNYDNKWYICQHRTEFGKDDGGISVYDGDWKFLKYIEIGKHCHNAVVKDGFLWSTKSYDGKLVRVELENPDNRVEYNVLTGYLSRGLIITDKYLLCGLSEFDIREKRHSSKNGRINIFKYPEIEFEDQIIIENCGQVNDLLLI